MEVVFTFAALADLARIRNYISVFNPLAAERMAERLIEAALSLSEMPDRGRRGVDGTRELTIVSPYVLVYEVDGGAVSIVRIWHGAQDR